MEYELTKQGQYQIKNFDEVKQDCIAFIQEHSHDIVIMNDADKKAVKEARTALRKKKDEIATYRKNFVSSIIGTFQEQAMSLEKLIDAEDMKLKQRVDDYDAMLAEDDEAQGDVTFQILVTSLSQEDIDKVAAYAKKLKCKVQVK